MSPLAYFWFWHHHDQVASSIRRWEGLTRSRRLSSELLSVAMLTVKSMVSAGVGRAWVCRPAFNLGAIASDLLSLG